MIPSHYHYSYSHKMPYSKIEAMGNMTTGWQMHKITRATHLSKPHITGSEVCEREKLKAGCLLQRSSLSASKICNCNQSSDARAGFCAVLFNFYPHTHTHITCQTQKQALQENKSKISKSYERSFFFYGIFPLKVRKAIPFNTTKYTSCLAYQFSIFSQCVFQSCTMKMSLNVMNPTIQKPILWNLTLCDLGCGCSGFTEIVIFEANIF